MERFRLSYLFGIHPRLFDVSHSRVLLVESELFVITACRQTVSKKHSFDASHCRKSMDGSAPVFSNCFIVSVDTLYLPSSVESSRAEVTSVCVSSDLQVYWDTLGHIVFSSSTR